MWQGLNLAPHALHPSICSFIYSTRSHWKSLKHRTGRGPTVKQEPVCLLLGYSWGTCGPGKQVCTVFRCPPHPLRTYRALHDPVAKHLPDLSDHSLLSDDILIPLAPFPTLKTLSPSCLWDIPLALSGKIPPALAPRFLEVPWPLSQSGFSHLIINTCKHFG